MLKHAHGVFADKWRPRFFELHGSLLAYKKAPEASLRGCIDLAWCTIYVDPHRRPVPASETPLPGSPAHVHAATEHVVFSVTSLRTSESYKLSADPHTATGWLKALSVTIAFARYQARELRQRGQSLKQASGAPAPPKAAPAAPPGLAASQSMPQLPSAAAGDAAQKLPLAVGLGPGFLHDPLLAAERVAALAVQETIVASASDDAGVDLRRLRERDVRSSMLSLGDEYDRVLLQVQEDLLPAHVRRIVGDAHAQDQHEPERPHIAVPAPAMAASAPAAVPATDAVPQSPAPAPAPTPAAEPAPRRSRLCTRIRSREACVGLLALLLQLLLCWRLLVAGEPADLAEPQPAATSFLRPLDHVAATVSGLFSSPYSQVFSSPYSQVTALATPLALDAPFLSRLPDAVAAPLKRHHDRALDSLNALLDLPAASAAAASDALHANLRAGRALLSSAAAQAWVRLLAVARYLAAGVPEAAARADAQLVAWGFRYDSGVPAGLAGPARDAEARRVYARRRLAAPARPSLPPVMQALSLGDPAAASPAPVAAGTAQTQTPSSPAPPASPLAAHP
jgi:hypothetical protein